MACVVTDSCRGCRDCVAVCPIGCFYEDGRQVLIHPDECINCLACYMACPVKAIHPETALPDGHAAPARNAQATRSGKLKRAIPGPLRRGSRRAVQGRSAAEAYRPQTPA